MRKIIITILLLATSICAEHYYEIPSGVVEYQLAGGDEMGNVRLIFKDYGEKSRTVLNLKEQNIDMYTIFNNGIMYAVDDDQHAFIKEDAKNNVVSLNTDFKNEKSIGQDSVAGKQCNIFQIEDDKYWVWKGLVLKVDSKDDRKDIVATSVQEVEAPDSAFNIPSDYKELTLPKK